jgi:hypothetical protein
MKAMIASATRWSALTSTRLERLEDKLLHLLPLFNHPTK